MLRFGDPGGRGYNAVGASAVNLLSWWNGSNSSAAAAFSITASGGRNGGNALHVRFGSACYVSKVLDNQQTWGIAFAIKASSFASGGNWGTLFTLTDSSTITIQTELRLGNDGTLRVFRGNGVNNGTTNVIATTVATLPINVWTHVEWLTKIHGSTGTIQIWINGVLAMNLINQNTQVSVNSFASSVYIGNLNADVAVTADFDDIVIYDGQINDAQGNPDITGPIGDCGTSWLLPNGTSTNGAGNTQWIPDSGANYTRVQDATPDITSYVSSNTINNIDTYTTTDLPVNVTAVKSILEFMYAQKDSFGSRSIAGCIRTGGANFVGNTTSIGNSYNYIIGGGWGQNPSGPANWTATTVNSIEVGQKVIS